MLAQKHVVLKRISWMFFQHELLFSDCSENIHKQHVRVLSLRSSVIHGFVTKPWYSRHVLFSCKRAASSVLEPCALSSACLVSCWSVVFGSRHSCLRFRFRVGVQTIALHVLSRFVSMRSRVCSAACSSVHMCCVLCCTQYVFYQAACIHVISCVNTWLMSFLISCVFVSCFAHGWWFVCWPCACVFVLCEHMAFVLVFCVPHALMSIVLTPPILYPYYWLICPTCLPSLSSSFSPFIISLCLQSCASSSSYVPLSCADLALPSCCSFSLFVLFYFWLI